MSAGEKWTAPQAAAVAQDAAATGTVPPETLSPRGNSGVVDTPDSALWRETPHALGVEANPPGGETNQEFAARVVCISNVSVVQPVAATRAVPARVECQEPGTHKCAPVHAKEAEKVPTSVGVASEGAQVDRCEEQPAGLESIPEAVHRKTVVRSAVKCQAEGAQPELCGDEQNGVIATPDTCEGLYAEGACRSEGAAGAGGVAIASPAPGERAFPKAALECAAVPDLRLKRGDVVMLQQGIMEPLSYAAAHLTPTIVNEELESCKQQLEEMKARLDALWSQKEAFRKANERLSRAFGRLQEHDIASRQTFSHPLKFSPSLAASATARRSPQTRTKQPPRLLPHQLFVPAVAGGEGDGAVDTALSTRSARRCTASPVAPFNSSPCGQAVYRSSQRKGIGSPPEQHRPRQRDATCERKATRECGSCEFKKQQPPSLRSCFCCPKASRGDRGDSSSFGNDDQRLTSSCRYSRASAGARASRGIPSTSRSQVEEVSSQLLFQQVPQRGLPMTQIPTNSRRSLPPVPRLDLQGVLQPQQRPAAGPASSVRGSARAVTEVMGFPLSGVHSFSRRGRRLSSSKRPNSSRSFADVEAHGFPVNVGHPGFSDETESLDARRESTTTQDSIRGGMGRGGKGETCRHMCLPRRAYKDGNRSRQDSFEEGSENKQAVSQRRTSLVAPLCRRKESAIGRRQIGAQGIALPDTENSPKGCSGNQTFRQPLARRKEQGFDTFATLQHRPVRAAGGGWKPVLSMRSTVGGLGQNERGSFSARPSLAETAMKTPRTCFLDDRIVRAPHVGRSFASGDVDPSLLFAAPAGRTSGGTAGRAECAAGNDSRSDLANDKETTPLSLEEQLAKHVRHCVELLQCTEVNREDDFKTANVSRPVLGATTRSGAARTAPSFVEGSAPKEEKRGRDGKRATAEDSSLSVPSSTAVSCREHTAVEAGEDSTLQACVRKPRDGYWHVIYTCVIKVRGTDFFLDVHFPGATADMKKCEAARLIASKERAGVFKVCIRHLLRSTRDFFDSARVLWWQPLPVVCNDEWLPYDEVMRCRADTQIRALRAKHPALAAAATERGNRKAATAQAAGEGDRARTQNRKRVEGWEHKDRDGRDACWSSTCTERTAQHVAKNGEQGLCPGKRGKVAEAKSACTSYNPQRRGGAVTERSDVKARTGTSVKIGERAAEEKDTTGSRNCGGFVSSDSRGSVTDWKGAGGSRLVTEKQRDPASTDQRTDANSSVCHARPRRDSEWDAVGLVYVGSLCSEQPVAQFKRILGSCSSNVGEAGSWYVSSSKPKPRCMHISPSSDISFLLSQPQRSSSTDNSDSSISSASSTCSSFSAATCISSDSVEPQKEELRSVSESYRSLCSKITAGSHTTEEDKDSPRQAHDEPAAAASGTSRAHFPLHASASAAERRGPHSEEVRTRKSSSGATNDSGSYSSRSHSSSATGSRNSSSISVTTSNNSGTAYLALPYSTVLAGKNLDRAVVRPETTEAAFDRTCQLSLSRKLGPQELFIVRRRDREGGCFPLYHHFSGRYLCVHATNGLIGMVCANATPAAAAAAHDVQKEIRASYRLAREGAQIRPGTLSESPALDGGSVKHPRPQRSSEDHEEKTTGEKSSKTEDQPPSDAPLVENSEKGPAVMDRVEATKESRLVEQAIQERSSAAAASSKSGTVSHTKKQSCPGLIQPTATAGGSCASAALFPPSPFFLSRLAHAAETPALQAEAGATACSSDSEDACARSQRVPSCASVRGTEENFVGVADTRESAPGNTPAETATQETVTNDQQGEGEPDRSALLKDRLSRESRRRVTVSAAQQGARKLGALMYRKRLKLQSKRLAEQSDIFASARRGEPSTKINSVQVGSAEALGDCTACEDTAGAAARGKGTRVYGREKLRNLLLTPSFFELVTVSDLLVQQTVAQILASVPQPTVVAEKYEELRSVSEECAHIEQGVELVDRVAEEAEASTQASGAEISKKKEGQSLTSDAHEAAEKQEAETPGTEVKSRDTKGTRLYCSRDCNSDGLADTGKEKPSSTRRETEFAAASTVVPKVASSSRRSCRYSDFASNQAPTAVTSAAPHCFFRASMPSRNSLPASKNNMLPRNFPLMLPIAAVKRGAAETQRQDVMQDSSIRMGRRISTPDTETHVRARLHQHHSGKHRQYTRRVRQTANRREQAFSAVAATNSGDIRSFGISTGCEQFSLDDCDALTEIATDEIRAGRHDG